MAIGRVNTGGGGGGGSKGFASIGVFYPIGSVCTCTDGIKTLKLKNTLGVALFMIPYAGDWTVNCVNGEKSTSKTISITEEGQNERITLVFELWIHKVGLGFVDDFTFKVPSGRESGVTANSERISTSHPAGFSLVIMPSIDVTNFNTLHFEWAQNGAGYQNYSKLSVSRKDTTNMNDSLVKYYQLTNTGGADKWLSQTIDLSDVEGVIYVKMEGWDVTNAIRNVYLS